MDCKNKTTKKCSDYRNETSSIFFLHQCFNIYLTYTFSDNSCLTVWLTGIWTPLNLKLAFSSLLVVGRSEKKSKHEERRLTLLRNPYEVTWTGKMPINHLCGIGETILWMCVQSFNIHLGTAIPRIPRIFRMLYSWICVALWPLLLLKSVCKHWRRFLVTIKIGKCSLPARVLSQIDFLP